MTKDFSDPQVVKDHAEKAKGAVESRLMTLERIMGDAKARKYMFDLLKLCGVGQPAFAQNALVMAHITGKQTIGWYILSDLMTAQLMPLYVQMMKENSDVA